VGWLGSYKEEEGPAAHSAGTAQQQSAACGITAKKKNSSEEMPKWIRAAMVKKHPMLFKCYLFDCRGDTGLQLDQRYVTA